MKKGNRALAVLLSLVITLSYMPAMAFAGTEEGGEDPSGNGAVETGLEVENDDLTSTGGDTGNDDGQVEETPVGNAQTNDANANDPTGGTDGNATCPPHVDEDKNGECDICEDMIAAQVGDRLIADGDFDSYSDNYFFSGVTNEDIEIKVLWDCEGYNGPSIMIPETYHGTLTVDMGGNHGDDTETYIGVGGEGCNVIIKNGHVGIVDMRADATVTLDGESKAEASSVLGDCGKVTIEEGAKVQNCSVGENGAVDVYGTISEGYEDFTVSGVLNIYEGATVSNTIELRSGDAILNVKGGSVTAGVKVLAQGNEAPTINVSGGSITNEDAEDTKYAITSNGCNMNVNVSGGKVDSIGTVEGSIYDVSMGLDVSGGEIGSIDFTGFDSATASVTGGTINSMTIPSDKKDAIDFGDTELIENEDGTYSVAEHDYVVQIGDKKYESLSAAVTAAKAGETIKLLGDIDLSKESITSGGYAAIGESCDVVLDLNGHAVTGAALDLYGKMVVDDSSSNKTGSITGVKHAIWVNPNATLEVKAGSVISGTGVAIASDNGNVTITGGEVRNDTGAQAISATDGKIDITGGKIISTKDDTPAIGAYGKCEVTVEGGTINGHDWGITVIGTSSLTVSGDAVIGTSETEGIGISTNGNSGQNATITINGGTISGTDIGIYQPSGTVTVSGGSISGATGIYQKSGKLTITGGTITGNGEKTGYTYNGNGANATGDAIVVDNCGYPGGVPAPAISGGTINSTNADPIGSYAYTAEGADEKNPVEGFISGGSFNKAVDDSLCAEGFVCEENADGTYGIKEEVKYTAKFKKASYNLLTSTCKTEATVTRDDGESLTEEDKKGWTFVDESGVLEQAENATFSKNIASLKVKRVDATSLASGSSTIALVKGGKTYATTTVNYSPNAVISTNDPSKLIESGKETVTALKINGVEVDAGDYVITSDDETIATVEQNGSIVVITPLKAGKVSFTVAKADDTSKSVKTSLTFKNAAAKTGDTYYETVGKAMNAAQSGDTVTLLNDVTEAVYFTGNTPRADGFKLTVDLNGHTWTGKDEYALRVDYGIVTVKDSSEDHTGAVKYGSDYAFMVSHLAGDYTSRLVLESGTFTGKSSVVQVGLSGGNPKAYYGGELVVNGGSFKTVDDAGEEHDAKGNFKYTLNKLDYSETAFPGGMKSESKITVNGGTFDHFDPQDNAAEGEGTDITSDGYVAIPDENGNYSVREGYKVTFDANGGAPAPEAQRVEKGSKVTKPEDPAVADEDTVFVGWFEEGSDTAFDFNTVIEADTKLTAKWRVKEYVTVTFDIDGTKTEAKIEKGSKVDNWPSDPTKENFAFDGWKNGETTYDKDSEFNESITLTATWVEAHATAVNNGKLGYWKSLVQACGVADSGTTVTLIADDQEAESFIGLYKKLTIDLNGHTWTYSGAGDDLYNAAFRIQGDGEVTFKDSSEDHSGQLIATNADKLIYNNARKNLTIQSGTYEGKNYAVYQLNNNSKTIISGGTIKGAPGKSVALENGSTNKVITIGKDAYFSDDAGNAVYCNRGDGYYLIKGADESKPDLYKLGQPVATIGDKYFGSLNAAVEAANAGETVKLVSDIELSTAQIITKDVTIDLNDHNIAATNSRALWIKSGDVEITGSGNVSATGEGLDESSSVIRVGDSVANTNKAKLTVGKNVTVSTDKSYGITVFGKNPNPISLELKGKVNVTGNSSAISGNGSAGLSPTSILITEGAEVTSANEYAIYHPEDGTLTVNGKVEGKGGIEIKSGKLIVGDSANITANGEPKYSGVNNNGPSTSGYAIASVGNGGYANVPAVEVQGGSVAGTVTSVLENNAEKSGEVTATSDQISVPEGYAWKEENGHYVLKTPLDFEKEAANKELDKVDIEQYSYDDLTKIRAAIEKARADVEAAKTVEDVEAALATFNEAKAECKTNAEKLAEAKSAANKQLDEYKPADYSGDDKTAVESAIAAAKTAIEGAKTIEAVDAAVAEAKAAIAACTTDAQKLDNAKANANTQLDAVDKTGLSEADAAKVDKAIADAKAAIDKAATVDAVNEALTAANATIADIKSDASKLAGAKELAKNQLDAIDTTQYSGDELEAVKKAIADAKTAIDEAATVSAVNKALSDANSTIAEQKTDEQKAADALQSAKDAANAELNAIDTSNYSGDELKAVKDAIAAARTAIETAKDVDAVTAAKSMALDTVSKQKTNAQKEAEKLAAAKDAALTELGKIDTTKYSGDDLKAVEKAIADAKTAIEAAETVDAVNAAVKRAEDDVAGQKTDEQKTAEALQNAKDAALADLEGIKLSDYSGEDLKTMEAAVKAAKAAINAAGDLDAVSAAKSQFDNDTKDCKTDEEKAEEATEENADKKLKEAQDAADAAKTAAETAEASKKAAEEAAKTPGQAAVDAAQKALDDANAAKQAADEAKAKAEAAKTAAEAVYGADSDQAKKAQNLVDNATTAANNAATAVTNAQSAVTNAKNAKAAADRAAAANKEIQDLPVVKITKPKAKKKKAIVRWKKVSKKNKKKIQGIQIQVATDPGFKNIVKNTTAKKTKKSKTIKGLKSKTRYWVRIRAYKNVGSVRHVSAWKVKKVKVK